MSHQNPFVDFVSAYLNITDDEMEHILQRIHHAAYAKNEVIHSQGKIARTSWFVIKGAVRAYYTDETGMEHTVNFIFENQPLVALNSFTHQIPSDIAFMAMEHTEVIWTSHAEFISFLELFPKFETALRTVLGEFLVLEGEHAKLMRINPAHARYDAVCKSKPQLVNRVPLKYLASYIGMTLETLSRVRAGKL